MRNRDFLWRRNAAKRRRTRQIVRRTVAVAAVGMLMAAAGLCWKIDGESSVHEIRVVQVVDTKADAPAAGLTQAPEETEQREPEWNREEGYMLAKLAAAEAEGESIEGKAMVIMVVLNRVETEEFPDTIQEVIYENNGKVYQFSPLEPGGRWWTTEPDEECWEALELIVKNEWDESEGALYFEATYNGENTWHSKNLEYIKTVGNHNFYK